MPKSKAGFDRLHGARRVVFVVCVGIYLAGALIGFDDYGKICLSADRVLWHGEGNCRTTRCDLHFIFRFCYNELPAAVNLLIEMCAKAHPAGECVPDCSAPRCQAPDAEAVVHSVALSDRRPFFFTVALSDCMQCGAF